MDSGRILVYSLNLGWTHCGQPASHPERCPALIHLKSHRTLSFWCVLLFFAGHYFAIRACTVRSLVPSTPLPLLPYTHRVTTWMAADFVVVSDAHGHMLNRCGCLSLPARCTLNGAIVAKFRFGHQVCAGSEGGCTLTSGQPEAGMPAFTGLCGF